MKYVESEYMITAESKTRQPWHWTLTRHNSSTYSRSSVSQRQKRRIKAAMERGK